MKIPFIFFIFKLFINGVDPDKVKSVSVMEGDYVTLHTGTKLQSKDVIEWRFEKNRIAKFDSENNVTTYNEDLNRRFINRLLLNNLTGDLTIKIRAEDSGLYYMKIFGQMDLNVTFNVHCVNDSASDGVKSVSVMNRDSVILHTGVTDMRTDDVIEWRFGPKRSLIAKTNEALPYDAGGIEDRLYLDHQKGDLTIRHIRNDTSGLYEVQITRSNKSYTITKRFNVTLSDRLKIESANEGQPVTLWSGVKEPYKDDLILWWFEHGDSPIAKIDRKAGIFSTYDGDDGRFKDRLQLDNQTGNLTITNTKKEDSGLYHVDSSSSTHTKFTRYSVNICAKDWPFGLIAATCVLTALLVIVTCLMMYYCHKARPQTVPVNNRAEVALPDNVAEDVNEGERSHAAASLLGQPSDPSRGTLSLELPLLKKRNINSSSDVPPET